MPNFEITLPSIYDLLLNQNISEFNTLNDKCVNTSHDYHSCFNEFKT